VRENARVQILFSYIRISLVYLLRPHDLLRRYCAKKSSQGILFELFLLVGVLLGILDCVGVGIDCVLESLRERVVVTFAKIGQCWRYL
jgi:ABC-type phosphonate transport system ATPase subunit